MHQSTTKRFACVTRLVSFVFALGISVTSLSGQAFKSVHDGVEYAEATREIAGRPVRMNILRLDLRKVRLDVHHAADASIGTEKTSSIAGRLGAVAAVNAGFFRLDKSAFAGDPAGVLIIDGMMISESSNDRVALGIVNGKSKTEVAFGHVRSKSLAGFGVDSELAFAGIDRERKADEIILYTSYFHSSTLTDASGSEIILSECTTTGVPKVSRCDRAEAVSSRGNSTIPAGGYVISIGKDAIDRSNNALYFANRKDGGSKDFTYTFRLVHAIESPDESEKKFFARAEDMVNGVPQLIKAGKIAVTWAEEKSGKSFVETRHPRTAVAKLKSGKFLMITVDGRSESSGGIGLYDLANLLLEFGAVDAMNLDGGGSTTMFLDGKVVNYPSDKEGERKVSDALIVTLRKK